MSQNNIPFVPNKEAFVLGGDISQSSRIRRGAFKHPMAALFHVLFKSMALLFYLFGGIFGQDFIATFVSVILLISMDFWVVKNVTGRLLVGLRWSNYIDDEGNSHWIFENKKLLRQQQLGYDEEDTDRDLATDSSLFWTALILAPAMWTLLMFVCLLRFNVQWFMLVTLASVLSSSNLYGYLRCRLGKTDIKSSVTQFVAKQVFLNYFTGGGGATSASGQATSWIGKPVA